LSESRKAQRQRCVLYVYCFSWLRAVEDIVLIEETDEKEIIGTESGVLFDNLASVPQK